MDSTSFVHCSGINGIEIRECVFGVSDTSTLREEAGIPGSSPVDNDLNAVKLSQAHLQAQLRSKLDLTTLKRLRKDHNLRSYLRSIPEIRKGLHSHQCTLLCVKEDNTVLGKRCRAAMEIESQDCNTWPEVLNDETRKRIVQDYIDETSDNVLTFLECSFCGASSSQKDVKEHAVGSINVDILRQAEKILRKELRNEKITVIKMPDNGTFITCAKCQSCIRHNSFFRIPLYSYANGCWIGEVPRELKGLTFLEEQCIARARCTRCTIKLSPGMFSQYASHGNVCVFPQEPKNLASVLPPSLSDLYDEIAVIFVASTETRITEKMLSQSPLLVRRQRILDALTWLKANNHFYEDLNISDENLSMYPSEGIPGNCPIQFVIDTKTEGQGYCSYENEANSVATSAGTNSTLLSCGVLDSDKQESSYKLRKLEMVREILQKNRPFVKYPSRSSQPLKTSYNPELYAILWPTLFPYGVGLFEDTIRAQKSLGFRHIDLKRHVKHMLNLMDDRFQKHITFPFVLMNIMQRKTSSFKSKLILKRTWFPKVIDAMNNINLDDLDNVKEKFLSKTPLSDSAHERAIADLLKYVNYISEGVSGSIGEVNNMRSEIKSTMRLIGLPHLFITINPADTYNPVMQVFGGRKIKMSSIFHDLSPGQEEIERMKCSTSNPAAAARAFNKIMQTFIGSILGAKRDGKMGVFGSLKSYYGVVEAQGRGSLHCHMFVWLEGGLDPLEIKDKLQTSDEWKNRFFAWLESCVKQDLPDNTSEYTPSSYNKLPLMSRPSNPTESGYHENFPQQLRDILDLTGQVHTHSATCYKHLPFVARSHKDDNADCRFGLPRETVTQTHVDAEGHVHLRCSNGNVNAYNDMIVYCLRCNMDCKFIGSGTAAMAMTEYVTNYIAKISMDSSVIFSCMCAALKAMEARNGVEKDGEDMNEKARLLLLKICNGLIGKRELSGQQVTSFLQNIPNRYTDQKFEHFWWLSILKYVAPTYFCLNNTDDDSYVVLQGSLLEYSQMEKHKELPSIILDYLYRPRGLQRVNLWEFWRQYKIIKRQSRQSESSEEERESMDTINHSRFNMYTFDERHPRHMSYIVIRRAECITPVLSGFQIPRNDRDSMEDQEKYFIAMLTLFHPWNDSPDILKKSEVSWHVAFEQMSNSMNESDKKTMRNFQSIHSCRDAAHDYSENRRKRLKTLMVQVGNVDGEVVNDLANDIDWNNAMQEAGDGLAGGIELEDVLSPRIVMNLMDGISNAETGGFYNVSNIRKWVSSSITEGTQEDIILAEKAYDTLMKLKERSKETVDTNHMTSIFAAHTSLNLDEPEQVTYMLDNPPDEKYQSRVWKNLLPHRKLCVHIINKYTLNDEQSLTFLLFADHYGLQYAVSPPLMMKPMRLIISGPGGTGKSQIFHAIQSFFAYLQHSKRLKLTAPTGLAANNIDGTTVHSEASLRVSFKDMLSETKKGRTSRSNIERRYQDVTTQILDEVYFLSAQDHATMSQYIGLATCRQDSDNPYGNLNMIFAGDPAQLPPPKAMSIFDRRLTKKVDANVNALNDKTKHSLGGVITWRQVEECIVLKKIMRQKDVKFQGILNRLRFGNCNEEDYNTLQEYVINNRTDERNDELLNISSWVESLEDASPLITYTNALRDIHNMRCAEAFALHTGQEFNVYHSIDTVNRGKTVLTNQAADAAWSTPVKKAEDLGGRLPLVAGMPIFLTHNVATELGLSNGACGRLIGAKYHSQNGVRYAICAEVEFDKYTHGPSEFPHRLLLKPIKKSISYTLPGKVTIYHATRNQLPILPAFSYTAHNSQSRSVDKACIDLDSCPSTAAAYVMLSRLKSLDGLSILRPFTYQKISRHCPEEVRAEIKRLELLSESTTKKGKERLKWYYDLIPPS